VGDADDELMVRAGAGDRSAGHALYVRHRDAVHALAHRYMGDDAAARDVAQDVFISILQSAARYRPAGSFLAYLRRVTVHRCINARAAGFEARRAPDGEDALLAIPDPRPDPEAGLVRSETGAAVRAALDELPARQRMAVVLSRFEELSYQEIAAALGCSVSSVESLLFRARQALARVLSRE
jgi:RNA polymerase sigma-70 factor (ECF subfamily)